MCFFIFFPLGAIVTMISNDFSDLFAIECFFGLNFLVEPVSLLFKLLNGDFFETDFAFEFFISVEEVFVALEEFFFLDSEFWELVLESCDFLSVVCFGFFYLEEEILVPPQIPLPGLLEFLQLRFESHDLEPVALALLVLDPRPDWTLLLQVVQSQPLLFLQTFADLVFDQIVLVLRLPDFVLNRAHPCFPLSRYFFHFHLMFLPHPLLNFLVFWLQLNKFFVGFSQLLLVKSYIMVLVSLDLLMLTDSSL